MFCKLFIHIIPIHFFVIHSRIVFIFRGHVVENESSEGETDDEENLTAASSKICKGMSKKKMVRKRAGRK